MEFNDIVRDLDAEVDLEDIARDNYTETITIFSDPELFPPSYFCDTEEDASSIELAALSQELARVIAPHDDAALPAIYRGLRFGEKLYASLMLPEAGTVLDTGAFLALGQAQQRETWRRATKDFLETRPNLYSLAHNQSIVLSPEDSPASRELTAQAIAFALMTAKEYGTTE